MRLLAASASALMLAVTGYGWTAYHDLSAGLTKSDALAGFAHPSDSGAGGGGPMNILVMGLDSRLDQNGQPLPREVLNQLHAGDSSNGGYNTNVLMLLHVPGDGSQAQAISIPRDDYVRLPGQPSGQSKAKIKEGYGLAKADAERQLRGQGVTDAHALEQQSREAGRKQTVATVQDFLGVRIDHFVEVTLVGFYDLAQALGSVTVCLSGATQDSYSGAHFAQGRQQLDAAQALAFVRQRRDYVHPELNFTDLDRARRQQAFLASAAYELKSAGTFTNPARLSALIDVAKKDIVIDESFDPLTFITQNQSLINGGVTFTTLPVIKFDTIDGQAVNVVDPEQNRAVVRALFGSPAASSSDTPAPTAAPLPPATLDVVNASGRDGLATRVADLLTARGLTRGTVTTDRTVKARSTLSYAPDAREAAAALAGLLDGPDAQPDPQLKPGQLRLVMGTSFTLPPDLTTTPESGDDTTSSTASPGSGQAPAVPASSIQAGGIPCVK
jgi:LCP family protein required for cell wall assembly